MAEISVQNSILKSTKKLIGIDPADTSFDDDLIIDINSVFVILYQMGIGPTSCFSITDETTTWADFVGELDVLEAVKSYIPLKVKMMFDPPTSSTVCDAIGRVISELESRLNYFCDPTEEELAALKNTDTSTETDIWGE